MSRRYLFMGGLADGTFRPARKDVWEIPGISPVALTFSPPDYGLSPDTVVYYRHWVKFPGWRVFVPVFLISGETISSLPLPEGYVLPGYVVGREDSCPIAHMHERQQFLREARDRGENWRDV